MSEPTATNVIAGPALFYVAPVGTTPPSVTGSPATWPPTFGAGWLPVGYTDKGVDLVYTPTVKPYTPDEETSPIYDILESEKCEVDITLAETTLDNLARAISAATLTYNTGAKVKTLAGGSLPLTYVALAWLGPAPPGPAGVGVEGRLVVIQKALAQSAIKVSAQRKAVTLFAVKWEARKIAGQDLYDIYDFYSGTGS